MCIAVSLSVSVCVSSSEGACEPASVCAVRGVCVCAGVWAVLLLRGWEVGALSAVVFPTHLIFYKRYSKKKKQRSVSFFPCRLSPFRSK